MTVTVIKEFNLCRYDKDMRYLYQDLKNFLQDFFPDGVVNFKNHERIVFYHEDLDYYVDANFPGFTLYNLQLILRELDIPNFFCAVISAVPGYDYYTRLVKNILRPDDCPLRAVTQYMDIAVAETLPSDINLNTEHITHPFIFQSRARRFHRTFFAAKIFEKHLQNKGLVSYQNISIEDDKEYDCQIDRTASTLVPDNITHLTFLSTTPFVRFNTENIIKTEHNKKLISSFEKNVLSFVNFIETDCDVKNKRQGMRYQNSQIQRGFLYVAPESTAKYPAPFLSGISFKSIAEKRPFVLFAVPGTIEYLKSVGFKTFDHWWDESYDKETDLEIRADMIVNIVDRISKFSIDQLQDLNNDMKAVLDHNYQHLVTEYPAQQKLAAEQVLLKNLIEH
jgi:hypothetical protein